MELSSALLFLEGGGDGGWGFVCCIGLEGEINASTFYLVTAAYRTDPDQINLQNFAV